MSTSNPIASHLLRSRLGKICVAVTGDSPAQVLDRAAAVLRDKESTFLEFRLDYLSDPSAALETLAGFLTENTSATVIATCRRQANGGRFRGSAQQELDLLLRAATAGFHLVDLEIESAEQLPKDALDRLRSAGAAVILSFHDFKATGDLDAVYRRMEPFAPDFLKVVPTAQTLCDNLTVMRFLERMEDRAGGRLVALCMGEAGVISRVLGLRAGSAFTFAASTQGEETAPGQLTARALVETYRIEQLDLSTKIYGVAGNPIGSSLSPLMMNTAFRRETVNAVYLALQSSRADDLFELAREVPIQGLSVTMPLKQDVIKFLERTDPLSTKIGAVNTILRVPNGKFLGFNTDVAGIVGPLERRLPLRGAKVLVLGAGGAARAAVFGCRDKGAEVSILNRTPETAQQLAKQSGAKCIKREAVAKAGFDVIINATPIGMNGNDAAPLLHADDLHCRLVFDLVYNPLETPLLRLARTRGIAVISGVEMFVTQGARQFEIWTGKPAPQDEMLRVVLHALRQAGDGTGHALSTATRLDQPGDRAPASAASPAPAEAKAPEAKAAAKKSATRPAAAAPMAAEVAPAKTAAKAAPAPAAKTAPAAAKAATKASATPAKAQTRPEAKTEARHEARPEAKTPAKVPAKATASKPPAKAPAKSPAKAPAKSAAKAPARKSR